MEKVRTGVEELPKIILKIQDPSTPVLKRPMNLIEKFLWEVSKIEYFAENLFQILIVVISEDLNNPSI